MVGTSNPRQVEKNGVAYKLALCKTMIMGISLCARSHTGPNRTMACQNVRLPKIPPPVTTTEYPGLNQKLICSTQDCGVSIGMRKSPQIRTLERAAIDISDRDSKTSGRKMLQSAVVSKLK